MNRAFELALLEELLRLNQANRFFLSDEIHQVPAENYTEAARFAAEKARLFRRLPIVAAHSNELPGSGDFVTRRFAGTPLLLIRDEAGVVRAFVNVCRHRGAELVGDAKGCRRMFSCPYHAWTYDCEGRLVNGPHFDQGFPGLIKDDHNLLAVPVLEREGLIWVVCDAQSDITIQDYVGPLFGCLRWSDMQNLAPVVTESFRVDCNWKILVEGGLEAYHFKVAHRKSIGPHFLDNLSTFRELGDHSVNVLAKNSLVKLTALPKEAWRMREHCNVIISSFPVDSFLLMEDHLTWIHMDPVAPDETAIRLTLLAPKSEISERTSPHWQKNHHITRQTLQEDWALSEGIQRGLASGFSQTYTFGLFESALTRFNEQINHHLNSTR